MAFWLCLFASFCFLDEGSESNPGQERGAMADLVLHPLVVVNIADQFTRFSIQNGTDIAMGMLLG